MKNFRNVEKLVLLYKNDMITLAEVREHLGLSTDVVIQNNSK